MLTVSILITVLALIFVFINRKNKLIYLIFFYLVDMAFLLLVNVIYISIVSIYEPGFRSEYKLFMLITSMRLHIYTVIRMYVWGLGLFMLISAIFGLILRKRRMFAAICISAIALFVWANDPQVYWKLFLKASENMPAAEIAINTLSTFNVCIVCVFMIMPLIMLASAIRTTRLSMRKRSYRIYFICILLIDIFMYFIALSDFDMILGINRMNMLSITTSSKNSIGQSFMIIIAVAVLIIIEAFFIYYRQLMNGKRVNEREILSSKLFRSGDFNNFLHIYKNSFICVERFANTIEKGIEKNDEQLVEESISALKNLSNGNLKSIGRMLKFTHNVENTILEMDLNECVREAVKTVSAPEKLRIEESYCKENMVIVGDYYHLNAVFINFLENAFEARDKTKEQSYVKIETFSGEDFCAVKISDNGLGIDKENIKKIFNPFFSTKSDKNSGGVGLSYSQTIINAHRGDIEVESDKGRYTAFTVVLPKY